MLDTERLDVGADRAAVPGQIRGPVDGVAQRFRRLLAEEDAADPIPHGLQDAAAAISDHGATAGLHLTMLALGLQPGDEVITTPMTFAATVSMIVQGGGTPVLADIEPGTLNIDVQAMRAKITPRTRALVPVHFAGQPCDMDEIFALVSRRRGYVSLWWLVAKWDHLLDGRSQVTDPHPVPWRAYFPALYEYIRRNRAKVWLRGLRGSPRGIFKRLRASVR